MTHFGARKTQAQRDAINARAAAWERPLSMVQRSALAMLAEGHLVYGVAGWHRPYELMTRTTLGLHFHTQTIDALVKRGLARRERKRADITAAGRKEHRRG